MNDIKLVLGNKELVIKLREVEGQQLYKAQDLLRGYFQDDAKMKSSIQHWKESMNSKGTDFAPLTIKGKYGGTYLTRLDLLELAGYVCIEFRRAVYKAFEALVDGDAVKALSIAQQVASYHREEARQSYKELSQCIQDTFEKEQFNFSHMHPSITYRHLNNLLWKYATGESLPKPSPKNLRDALVEQGRATEAMRLEAGTHVLIALLRANLPYETIKASMGIK